MASGLVVIGTSGLAVNAIDTARALGRRIAAFVEETRSLAEGEELAGVPVFGSVEEALSATESPSIFVAVGDNYAREQVAKRVIERHGDLRLESLVHPSAWVSPDAIIGPGTLILAGTQVSGRVRIGEGCFIAYNSVVAHNASLGNYVSFGSGTVTGGRVEVGDRTALGLNSTVLEKTLIGRDAVVGAASLVTNPVADQQVVVGIPARVIRYRSIGDPYLR